MMEHLPTAAGEPRADEALPLELSQEDLAGGRGDAKATVDHAGGSEGMLRNELADVL